MAAGPAQSPEMSRLHTRHHHHHHHPPTIDRRPDGLAPSSRRESPDGLALPERAFQSPSRDSFASKPSVSDASSRSDQSQQQQYHQHHHHTLSYQAAPHRQPSGSPGDRHSARPSQPNARDVEKLAAADAPRDREHRRSRGPTVLADETTTVTYNGGYDDDDDDYREERRMLESKALSTLVSCRTQVACGGSPPNKKRNMRTKKPDLALFPPRSTSPAAPASSPSSSSSGRSSRSSWCSPASRCASSGRGRPSARS